MSVVDDSTIVTHEDAKALGYCNAGLRRWFSARSDVTFDQFRREGVTIAWLESLDNGMANRLADFARQRATTKQEG